MSKDTKIISVKTNHELERLKKLRRYDILETPPEMVFDIIAEIAKSTFSAAGSFVSFVDEERVFLKSNTSGIPVDVLGKDESLCSVAIKSYEVTVIPDAKENEDVKASRYVKMTGGIRYYAAAPIITPEGYIIGTVSVMDIVPRNETTAEQLTILEWLAVLTLEKLESRLINRVTVKAYDDRLHRIAHDMKNPATSLIGYAQLMSHSALNADRINHLGEKIETIGRGIVQTMDNLLSEAQNENASIDLKFEKTKVGELIDTIAGTFEMALKNKGQILVTHCETKELIQIDRERILEVFTNLMSNAIKYSYKNTEIRIICTSQENEVVFEFKDSGVGMTDEDIKKLFTKFAKLSSIPTGKERSNGIGLYIVKTLVQLHGGRVWASSKGKGLGSSFFIALPKLESPAVND